jgi:hypothetical protein
MDDSILELSPRPLAPVTLAKEAARTNLVERLVSAGKPRNMAEAIARIVVDPAEARWQIEHPLIKRFPRGSAEFLEVDVFTPGVLINPANPRQTEQRVYPIAMREDEPDILLLEVQPVGSGQAMLRLNVESPDHMAKVLIGSQMLLQSNNESAVLREEIMLDGVLEPITVVLGEIHHRDGTPPVLIPLAVDGSTRMTHSHTLIGLSEIDIAYRWSQAPSREWRGMLNQHLRVRELSSSAVTEEQMIAHRVLTCRARILLRIILLYVRSSVASMWVGQRSGPMEHNLTRSQKQFWIIWSCRTTFRWRHAAI